MRKALVGLCAACLLILLAAIPLSLALRAKRDWRALYCSLVQEKFAPWFKTQKNPEIFSFDWFDIHFSLFDLNGDGTPELFLDRAWWAGQKNASDLVGVYTIQDGKLRKFEEGPQDTQSNERYYLRSEWMDCGIGYQWQVTWYDFETCTLGGEVTDTQEKFLGLLADEAEKYGVAGGWSRKERTTWFRVAEWFNAPDPNAGPEITDNLPMSLYIRKDQIKGTADFRAMFTRAMERNLEHSSAAYMPDPPYDTAVLAAPASAAPRDNWRELYFEVLVGVIGALSVLCAWALAMMRRAKRREESQLMMEDES